MTIDNTKLHNLEDAAKKASTGATDGGPLRDALNKIPHEEMSAYMTQYEKDRQSDKGIPPGHYDTTNDQLVFEANAFTKVYDYNNYLGIGPKDFKENVGKEVEIAAKGYENIQKVASEDLNVAHQVNKIIDRK